MMSVLVAIIDISIHPNASISTHLLPVAFARWFVIPGHLSIAFPRRTKYCSTTTSIICDQERPVEHLERQKFIYQQLAEDEVKSMCKV
jgi:hypothetical protein